MKRKTVMITGATSGIGEACARRFAASGYNLILTGRNTEKLESLKKDMGDGTEVLTLAFDVRDAGAAAAAVGSLQGGWREIDVLVNNAGLALGLERSMRATPKTGGQ